MKTTLVSFLLLIFLAGKSQTNVSGGIFSNTIWTQANSPYIVTGNVVVFPGVALAIQAGVTVKFDSGTNMEIRQGELIAIGTTSNPVVFTSNSPSPFKGIWGPITSNQALNIYIDHCEFRYASTALTSQCGQLTVVNSLFSDNITGMDAQSNNFMRIDRCKFRNNNTGQIMPAGASNITNCSYIKNSTGLHVQSRCNVLNCIIDSNAVYGLLKHVSCGDTIRNNEIEFNGTGIANDISGCGGNVWILNNLIKYNGVGILLENSAMQTFDIHSNVICSNTNYNFLNKTQMTINATNNCWCSGDANFIASKIFDAYDDVSNGVVTFNPFDNTCTVATGLATKRGYPLANYAIFPNPISTEAILEFDNPNEENISLTIFDSYGRAVRSLDPVTTNSIKIERNELMSGMYLFQLQSGNHIVKTGKFIIE